MGKARVLLDAIGRYQDSQGAFAVLRSCTGWAKILYSCRTVPPSLQAKSLDKADRDIRHSLGRLLGSPLSDDDCRLASIGVANGGIGARSASEHAPAACISTSLAQSQELCARMWPGFDEYDIDGGLRRSDTESDLISSILPNASIYGDLPARHPRRASWPRSRQKLVVTFSVTLLWNTTASPTSASIVSQEPERGCSPSRTPSSPTSWHPYSGSAFADDSACSSGPRTQTARSVDKSWTSGATTPKHAGAAAIWVTRHNLIRDVVHSAATDRANLATVLEKPDPPDPSISAQRPTDVLVPRGPSGGQEAWDFSITSAFRLGPTPPDPSAFAGIFARSNPARTRSSTRPPSAPKQASLSARSYWRLWEEGGPTVFGRWSLGSPVRANGPVLSVSPTAASKSRSASHAPFTGKTLARS